MLAHQGALALELWTGVRAPVDRMKRTVQLTLEMQAEAAVGVRER
jgi:shikimate 5-dehydrogenase